MDRKKMRTFSQPHEENVRASTSGSPERYDLLTRILHWIFAIGIIYASIVGYALLWVTNRPLHDFFGHLNMSLATILIGLFPIRVIWKFMRKNPPPPAIDPTQYKIARGVQTALYMAITAALISGYCMVPHSYSFFGLFDIATPFEKGTTTDIFFIVHRVSCACLAACVVLHVLGVAKHLLHGQPGILKRMI
jgi:superoxide oxidase